MSDTNTESFSKGDPIDRENPFVEWRDLLVILHERKWIAVTVFMAIFAGTLIWTFRQTPRYRAKSSIEVILGTRTAVNLPSADGAVQPVYMYSKYVNTLVLNFKNATFLERVAGESLRKHPDIVRSAVGETELAAAIPSVLTVKPDKNSQLINIFVEHRDPEFAALLANEVADQFIRHTRNRRMESSTIAVTGLEKHLEQQRSRLAEAEAALRDYREKARAVSLEPREDIVGANLRRISEALTSAEMSRIAVEARWREVEEQLDRNVAPEQILAIATDARVAELRQQLMEKRGEVAILRQRYKHKHPTMIRAQAELNQIRELIDGACVEARKDVEAQYKVAKANEDGLREALREQESQAFERDRLLLEYDELKRNRDADRELYEKLLTGMKEAHIAANLERNNLQSAGRAQVPSSPYRPQKAGNLARGAGAGLVLGILMAFVAHLADDRIRHAHAFERNYGVTLLSMIPQVRFPESARRARVVDEDMNSAAAEAFRALRASLLLKPEGQAARRIMISSASSGEGKSLVAANLAIVFAMNGERTLLIDADLRRPAVHRIFGIRGLADHKHPLQSTVPLKEAVHASVITNLDILSTVHAMPGPAELLASPRMSQIFDEASAAYDRVIVDSPPLFGVSDPLILLPSVDGVILVVRHRHTRRSAIDEALAKLFEGRRATILGAVLNNIDQMNRSYYYYYRDHDHYYGNDVSVAKTGRDSAEETTSLRAPSPNIARQTDAHIIEALWESNWPATDMTSTPSEVEKRLEAAIRLSRKGNPYKARDRLEKLVTESPNCERAWEALLDLTVRMRDHKSLEQYVSKLHDFRGNEDMLTLLARGHLSRTTRDFSRACVIYHRVLELSPAYAPALESISRCELALGQVEMSKVHAGELLQQDPENADAHYVLGSLNIVDGNVDAAMADLTKSIERQEDPEALSNCAWLMCEKEDYRGALRMARTALNLDSGLYHTWDTLGVVFMKTARLDEACSAFQRALSLSPEHWTSMLNLARTRVMQGRQQDAVKLVSILDSRRSELDLSQKGILENLTSDVENEG